MAAPDIPCALAATEVDVLRARLAESNRYLSILLDAVGGTYEVTALEELTADSQVVLSRSITRPGVTTLHRSMAAASQAIEKREPTG